MKIRHDKVTPKVVKTYCGSFLVAYFGSDSTAHKDTEEKTRDLGLRLVCLGNPERTVQGELLHYLRARSLNAISECGLAHVTKRKNNPDIVVFDGDWQPVCVIELKHFSANQGKIGRLLANMRKDVKRHNNGPQKRLPLIEIGLYTAVSQFDRRAHPRDSGLYRFLFSYCKKQLRQTFVAQKPLPKKFSPLAIPASESTFSSGESTVRGSVAWSLSMFLPMARKGPNWFVNSCGRKASNMDFDCIRIGIASEGATQANSFS